MSLGHKLQKVQRIRSCVGLILFGILFTAFAVLILRAPDRELVKAEATIVDIVKGYDRIEEQTTYTVYIDYEANGVEYKSAVAPSYSSGMKVGDAMEVYYDPADPEALSSTDSDFIVYVVLAVGLAALAFGVIGIVRSARKPVESFNEYGRMSGDEQNKY